MMDLVDLTAAANLTASTPWPLPAPKLNETIVYAVLLAILACVGIVGNGFVILAFKVNYKLRTVTNACFVSLALCDFLVNLISIPLWIFISFNLQETSWPRHLYSFYIFLDIFNSTASILQLTAISLERCLSIVAPVRHRAVPTRFYYVMLLTVWILAAASSLFYLMFPPTKQWYPIYSLVVCFSLPVLIMTISYTLIFRTAMKHSCVNVRSSEDLQPIWSRRLKTIVTLLIITGLFLITWTPFFTYNSLIYWYPSVLPNSFETQNRIMRFVKWMHYCNSSLNPFVYAYRHNEFNHSFKAIFHACMKCKRYNEVSRELRRPNNRLQLERTCMQPKDSTRMRDCETGDTMSS